MDFLKSIGDIFQRERVPMQGAPSIVKLGEGEEIVMDNKPQAMTHGPDGMFGDIYGNEVRPTPQAVQDQHREDYAFPNPMVMQEELAATMEPNSPMPMNEPSMPEPLIPPELNETVEDMADQGVPVPDGYETYTDKRGRTKIRPIASEGEIPVEPEVQWKATGVVPEGYEEYTDKRGRTDIRPKNPTVPEEGEKKDRQERRDDFHEWRRKNVPGEQNTKTPLTDEEAAVVDEAISGMPSAPDPDAPPNVDTTPPLKVRTPDGEETTITKEKVEAIAEEDPSGFSKAMSWITRTFGVTGQDLSRFAALYAASRLAGYDHQGSMSWSFEVVGTDHQERRRLQTSMANTGKFEPASLEEFRKTGDFSKLKEIKDPSKNGIKVDYTGLKYTKDGKVAVYPATRADGTKVYVDSKGNTYTGEVMDPKDEETNREIYREYEPTVSAIAKEMTEVGPKENDWYTGSETADAAIATEFAMQWAADEGIPPNSAAFGNIVRGAYEQARRWARATGNEVGGIGPFLDQQRVYITSEDAWAGDLKDKNGQKLDVEKFGQLSNSVMQILQEDPNFEKAAKKADEGTMVSWAMKALHEDFNALPKDQKAVYDKKGGFYAYLQEATLNPFDN